MQICRYFILFIANGVRISIEDGYHSSWNYGAAIGMSKTEFLHCVSRWFFYGGYTELAVYMSNLAERSEIDFGTRLSTSKLFD